MAGGASGQELEKDRQFLRTGNYFFYSHDGHMDPGKVVQNRALPSFSTMTKVPGLGQGEIRPADAQAGLKIFFPKKFPGHHG